MSVAIAAVVSIMLKYFPALPAELECVCMYGHTTGNSMTGCVCYLCGRLLGWVEAVGGCLLSEEDFSLTQQVSAISNVEGSIFMEASAEQLNLPER